jgi:hypothetical protein
MRKRINDDIRRSGALEEQQFYVQRYPSGYRHDVWGDHVQRVSFSVSILTQWAGYWGIKTIADLSAGDGAIARGVASGLGVRDDDVILGDINPCHDIGARIAGPLPDTLEELPAAGVDLFILSETIEHVEDPDFLLEQIRQRARYLFVSTPVDESPVTHHNPEHYWSWGTNDVATMLGSAGWNPIDYMIFTPDPRPADGYDFQMWVCE